jgi:hypothetical protein
MESRAVLASLLLTITAFAFAPTPASAIVCVTSFEPGEAQCGPNDVVCAELNANCATLLDDCFVGQTWHIRVTATSIGPFDATTGEVKCNGNTIAVCTVTFTTIGHTCTGSGAVEAEDVGAMLCVRTDLDGNDGITLRANHECWEPPRIP